MAEKIEQPDFDLQKELDVIMTAGEEEYVFLGKKRKMGWMYRNTMRKFSHLMTESEDNDKNNIKLCAAVLCNGVFAWFYGIAYAICWRWLYYVRNVNSVDVLMVISMAKKKIPHDASLMVTILSTAMNDLMMAMTKKEAKLSRVGRRGEPSSR